MKFEISSFALCGQSSLSSSLAAVLPIFPLALAARALFIAELLSRALYFKEFPALGILAHANIAGLKKLAPEDSIEKGTNSELDVGIHFETVRKGKRREHI